MRPREDELIDPEIAEQLDAIDATLAGEPVDPRFAEIAELALLLAVTRPEAPRREFADELDRRVQARLRRGPDALANASATGADGGRAGGRLGGRIGGHARRWHLTPAWGAAGTALAAAVIGIAVVSSGGNSNGVPNGPLTLYSGRASAPSRAQSIAPSMHAGAGAVASHNGAASLGPNRALSGALAAGKQTPANAVPVPGSAAATLTAPSPPSHAKAPSTANALGSGSVASAAPSLGQPGSSGSTALAPSPSPVPNGRKIVQSSSLELGTKASRIDAVAQEVFNVVGTFQGIVDSSNVASTGGLGASAQFDLRIPSGALAQTLSQLSQLPYAKVIARVDNTQDINSSFVSTRRQIDDAKAALASLRLKLAVATTATEIASLKAQIANESATLKQARKSLRSLNRRVDYSRVYVTIQADGIVPTPVRQSGGFGLHQAGHDALRVLEVSAGVALIALAVIVPTGLLAALGWWVGATVQRRRRERALDLA